MSFFCYVCFTIFAKIHLFKHKFMKQVLLALSAALLLPAAGIFDAKSFVTSSSEKPTAKWIANGMQPFGNAAAFNVNFTINGSGFSSSTMTARTLSSIEFTGSYSFSPNTACTEPFTILCNGETVLSTLASDNKIVTEEDDWGDETTAIYFNPNPFNQAGTYTISCPEGFFKTSSGNTSNLCQMELKLTSPTPSEIKLVVDGKDVELIQAEGTPLYTATNVELAESGSLKIQGTTYYGAVNGTSTALEPGKPTPIGYNGKPWTLAAGKYDVTLNWDENNPTITVSEVIPAVDTFDLGISVQGATASGTAKEFQRIDLPAKWTIYWLNNKNEEPVTVAWNDETIYSISSNSSMLIPMDNDDDWEDDAYMINLGERINRVGVYTITVPQGFFTSGAKVNAAVTKTVSVTSPMPAQLTIRGRVNTDALEADVPMTLNGSVFTADKIEVKNVADGYGELQLVGDSWYGCCNGQSEYVSTGVSCPIGYQGGYWKVAAGTYKVTVDWTDNNPMMTFVEGASSLEEIDIHSANNPAEYYTLQGIRIERPSKGQLVIEVRSGNAVKKQF